jgi:hypothetical protein
MSTLARIRKPYQRKSAAAETLAARFRAALRIPRVEVTTHPVLRGDRNYLRALRAAEMAAWEASLPLELAASFAHAVAFTERN